MGFTGLALPILPVKGRSVLIDREAYVRQFICVALSTGMNTNPYNDVGWNDAPVFKNPDSPENKLRVLSKIASIFSRLEADGLARLRSTPSFFFDDQRGHWFVKLDPVSLETLDSLGNPTPFPFDAALGRIE